MDFQKSMNNLKRVLFSEVTNHFVSPSTQLPAKLKPMPAKILICRPNHRLGNLLLITPLLQEVSEIFPNCKIDLFVKGDLGPILFKNYKNVNNIIQLPKRPFQNLVKYVIGWIKIKSNPYDIAINVDKSSSSGRMSVQIANSRFKVQGNVIQDLKAKFPDYEHHAKFPVYNLRMYLKRMKLYQNDDRTIPSLDLKLEASEIAEGKKLLRNLVRNDKSTICLFTFATGKKCHSEQWWVNFYERLTSEFPHVNIIEILPIHKASQLSSRVISYYSRDVRQIASVLANSALFVGADSGMMHLASSAQIPTVGLFSVTDKTRYTPYANNSIAIETNSRNTDECVQLIASVLKDTESLCSGAWRRDVS